MKRRNNKQSEEKRKKKQDDLHTLISDEQQSGSMFNQLPFDTIIVNEIFTYFPCQWLFKVAFMVCKSWYNSVFDFNKLIVEADLSVSHTKNTSFLLCCEEGRFNSSKEFRVRGFDFNHFSLAFSHLKFTAIQKLDLSYSKLGDEGMEILHGSCDQLKGINSFSYRYNLLTPKGLSILCSLPLKKLKILDLSFNKIGDEGCKILGNANFKNELTQLELYENGISNFGFKSLIVDCEFTSLELLNLRFNSIDSNSLTYLTNNNSRNIRQINLLFNKIKLSDITEMDESVKRILLLK